MRRDRGFECICYESCVLPWGESSRVRSDGIQVAFSWSRLENTCSTPSSEKLEKERVVDNIAEIKSFGAVH